jgi:hypothetical protein
MIPLSKDVARAETLRRSLAVYRMAFGQSRQDDLVAYLQQHLKPEQIDEAVSELQIGLAPTPSNHRSNSGKNQEPGELGDSSENEDGTAGELGLSTLENLLDTFSALRQPVAKRSASAIERLLNDFVAVAALDPARRQKWQSDTQTLI